MEGFLIELIVISQILISIIALVVTFVFYYKNTKIKKHKNESHTSNDTNILEENTRHNFRITLYQQPCLITLIQLENSHLKQLKNKQFYGYIENISTSGLKFLCHFNFPVKERVLIKLNVAIKSYHFILKGEIIRKEEHKLSNQIAYGVKFYKLTEKERMRITKALNEVMVEKEKKAKMYKAR
ncbi:PilZ domain-containing protein [Gracilibacillus sp. D59]|uniref:PilZ domain-containing protein n=1 Tax=Gracilibacillus sp. D59 TaxID=3457434 RepID=UPI003FCDD34F